MWFFHFVFFHKRLFAKMAISLEEVNGLDYPDFISRFSFVIEHGTLAAATVWGSRPFLSLKAFHEAFHHFLFSLSSEAREGVVRCYPDLAGRLAEEDMLTKESLSEHKAAGLLELTEEERRELGDLNSRYKRKFSFPFVICARENKKEAILKGIRARLENAHGVELENALNEISKIAHHRIASHVADKNHGHLDL